MRAFLVGAELRGDRGLLRVEDSLDELRQLALTAGIEVVGQATQKLERTNPATYIGPGKVEEVQALVAFLKSLNGEIPVIQYPQLPYTKY